MKEFLKRYKAVFVFLLKMAALYTAWTGVYMLILKPDKTLDQAIIHNLIKASEYLLNIFGYKTFTTDKIVGIENTSGLIISAVCDGLDLFVLFSIFILAFPIDTLQTKFKILYKLGFILFGIFIIHALNILRIISLAVIELKSPSSLEFNHSYTFTLIMYVVIFLMWMYWVKKNQEPRTKSQELQG